MSYDLLLYTPVAQGTPAFVAEITHQTSNWRRSTKLQGGYWQGTFTFQGTRQELQRWFYERLGYHVAERTNGVVTWEGMIYEMDLTTAEVTRRRSLDAMTNSVLIRRVDYEGHNRPHATYANTQSQGRYGRRDDVATIHMGQAPDAPTMGNRILKEAAWPWARPVTVRKGGADSLTVTVCGYAFAANWRYIYNYHTPKVRPGGGDDLAQIAIPAFLKEIADSYLTQFLTWTDDAASRTNTLTVLHNITSDIRAWDWLQEQVALGDTAYAPWRLWVGAGRRLHYGAVSLTPALYLRDGGLYSSIAGHEAINPRNVQPCVVRDLQYSRERAEYGGMLTDARDILIDEVSVDADDTLNMHTSDATESDIANALEAARQAQTEWLHDYWDKASEADRARRKAEWERTHPPTERFPG